MGGTVAKGVAEGGRVGLGVIVGLPGAVQESSATTSSIDTTHPAGLNLTRCSLMLCEKKRLGWEPKRLGDDILN